MNEPVNASAPTPERAPSAAKPLVSPRSITYGKPPIDPNASGRRARLRHPRRADVRH